MPDIQSDLQLDPVGGGALHPGNAADDAMLRLLAHMVVSDGVVHAGELEFLGRLMPKMSTADLEKWAVEHGSGELNIDAIAGAITDPDLQWRCLRYVARMAWKDGELADEETDLLNALAGAMSMPGGAVDRVLGEMSPDDGNRFTTERIMRCLVEIHWDAVQLASGNLVSDDLLSAMPAGVTAVARVGLDRVECVGIADSGLVARFQEGAAWLSWADVVTYTRAFGLGAAVTLHTEDGRRYTLVDSRLSGLAVFLDRLLGSDEPKAAKGSPLKIEQVRGDS